MKTRNSTMKAKNSNQSRNAGKYASLLNELASDYKRSHTKNEPSGQKVNVFYAYDEPEETSPVIRRQSILKSQTIVNTPQKLDQL